MRILNKPDEEKVESPPLKKVFSVAEMSRLYNSELGNYVVCVDNDQERAHALSALPNFVRWLVYRKEY